MVDGHNKQLCNIDKKGVIEENKAMRNYTSSKLKWLMVTKNNNVT